MHNCFKFKLALFLLLFAVFIAVFHVFIFQINISSFNLYKFLIHAFLLAILSFVIVNFFISKYYYEPISRSIKLLDKISNLELPLFVLNKSPFEMGLLEKQIEKMSADLKVAFDELSSQNSKMSAILSNMSEGVIFISNTGAILSANKKIEQILGGTEPQMIGKSVREIVLNNEITELIEVSLQEKKHAQSEVQVLSPFEGVFDVSADPVFDKNRQIIGAVCVFHDVTKIRKLEKHRSEFVANVSHELKTPLTAITNYVETLIMGAINDKENNVEFLKKIEKHAKNLSALIDDILEISKLENKKEIGAFSVINVFKVLEKTKETVLDKANRKHIVIEEKSIKKEVFILGFEEHVYRAILNILDNAINYTHDGGNIEISCFEENNKVFIEIKDSGIGIDKEYLPRIFERFYRVDNARSRDLGGTGLGLAIVKHIMNIHGGEVEVTSKLGKGSVFTLVFPSAKKDKV